MVGMPWRRARHARGVDHAGWVEDNVLTVLGLVRDASRPSLEDVEGVMAFLPLRSVEGSMWMSQVDVFRVVYKRKPRVPLYERALTERVASMGLQFEPMQRIPCKGGVELLVHSFRPQRPRANVSQGIRTGVLECEVVQPR